MQLEQLGTDVLAAMDQPTTWDPGVPYPKSPLEEYIETDNQSGFRDTFSKYSNTATGTDSDNINFMANIYYYDENDELVKPAKYLDGRNYFAKTGDYYNENAVKVTRWVNIENSSINGYQSENGTVLLEVLLWRG